MDALSSLLGASLIVLAHPDDECVTYGALLQRMADPTVLFLTDGAPRDPFSGSATARARLTPACGSRRRGRRWPRWAFAGCNLPPPTATATPLPRKCWWTRSCFAGSAGCLARAERAIERLRPQALLTLAYEGGHPDHDSCNLLVSLAGRTFGLPAWEAPIYSRARETDSDRRTRRGSSEQNGTEIDIRPTPAEVARKREMWLAYGSQGDFLRFFSPEVETVRPLPAYDYSQPPHPGKLNYEHWQWSMTGQQVCAAFREFLKGFRQNG